MRARLQAALPAELAEAVAFPRRAITRSDASVYRDIGIPGLIITNAQAAADLGDPTATKSSVDPKSLERVAMALGHMLVAIGGHEEPLASATGTSRYLAREGPRFAVHDQGALLGADPTALLDQGVAVRLRNVRIAGEAHAQTFRQQVADDDNLLWIRNAGDLRQAWHAERIGLLPRALCAAWFAKDLEAAIALSRKGYRLLAPFAGPAAATLDVVKVTKACAEAGVVLDLAGLVGERLTAAWNARGTMPCVYYDPRPKDGAPPAFPKGVEPTILLVPATGASLVKPLSLEPRTVALTMDTPALEGDLSAVTLVRSDMWWKPETAVRAHLRAFLGGGLEWALATHD
jgi:hypothetical protein